MRRPTAEAHRRRVHDHQRGARRGAPPLRSVSVDEVGDRHEERDALRWRAPKAPWLTRSSSVDRQHAEARRRPPRGCERTASGTDGYSGELQRSRPACRARMRTTALLENRQPGERPTEATHGARSSASRAVAARAHHAVHRVQPRASLVAGSRRVRGHRCVALLQRALTRGGALRSRRRRRRRRAERGSDASPRHASARARSGSASAALAAGAGDADLSVSSRASRWPGHGLAEFKEADADGIWPDLLDAESPAACARRTRSDIGALRAATAHLSKRSREHRLGGALARMLHAAQPLEPKVRASTPSTGRTSRALARAPRRTPRRTGDGHRPRAQRERSGPPTAAHGGALLLANASRVGGRGSRGRGARDARRWASPYAMQLERRAVRASRRATARGARRAGRPRRTTSRRAAPRSAASKSAITPELAHRAPAPRRRRPPPSAEALFRRQALDTGSEAFRRAASRGRRSSKIPAGEAYHAATTAS